MAGNAARRVVRRNSSMPFRREVLIDRLAAVPDLSEAHRELVARRIGAD